VGAFAAAYAPEQVTKAARGRGEPDWLIEARAEAARAFAVTPMPTPKLRPWKYTDVTALAIDAFDPAADVAPEVTGTPPPRGFAGTLQQALLDNTEAERVREHLGSVIPATEGKFIAANSAHWTDGVYVHAPRGEAFDAPVIATLRASGGAIFPRVLLIAEPQAEVNLVLRYFSDVEELLAPGVIEIVAGQDSKVRVLLDLDWGAETQEFTTVRARLDRDANVQVATLALGGRVVKQTLEGLLEGEGSAAQFHGVALGDRNQHFDFVTLQDHIGPRTLSDVSIKAALAGASKAVYYGITRVEETASGAQAEQENRNLLLSKHAKANSDPVLEILTNEVIRCGHGATVGPVDQEALFYLQSRGLSYRQALTLLVAGFFRSVIEDIGDEALEEELAREVEQKLAVAEL
jgi:Fe-S cluster assembly protein SufD